MNKLVLPTEANGFNPPVKSFVFKNAGVAQGIRLISYKSLSEFIQSQLNQTNH